MKKLVARAVVLVMMLGIFAPTQFYASEINVTIDGAPVVFENQGPVIIEGRTLIPVRGVFEALGFDVGWEQATQTVSISRCQEFSIFITIGSDVFMNNGVEYPLDVPAQIIEGSTMLPIRAVLESTGSEVGWNQDTSTVVISTLISSQELTATPEVSNASDFELRVFELVNAERANYGLPALIWCDVLADAARAHSRDLAVTNTFSHTSSDGTTMRERITATGLANMGAAENIDGGSATPEGAMINWLGSTHHRNNILHTEMTHIGVGFYTLPGTQWEFYTTKKFIIVP